MTNFDFVLYPSNALKSSAALRDYFPIQNIEHNVCTVLKSIGGVRRNVADDTQVDRQNSIGIVFDLADISIISKHQSTYLVLPWLLGDIKSTYESLLKKAANLNLGIITLRAADQEALQALAPDLPIFIIPPIDIEHLCFFNKTDETSRQQKLLALNLNCGVLDSNEYDQSTELFRIGGVGHVHSEYGLTQLKWDGTTFSMNFNASSYCGIFLDGFYAQEAWGAWSRTDTPSIDIPYLLVGTVYLTIEANAYGRNIDQSIIISLGGKSAAIKLGKEHSHQTITFELERPQSKLSFTGINLEQPENIVDDRTMGIGLGSLTISASAPQGKKITNHQASNAPIKGITYTTIIPASVDDSYGWKDLISAFTHAFQHTPNVTLIINIDIGSTLEHLLDISLEIKRAMPFKCRIILINGALALEERQALIQITDFYVNSATLYTSCINELEFMHAQTPLISPQHDCLTDIINKENTLLVKSSYEPQHIESFYGTTAFGMKHRIDWGNLVSQLTKSKDIKSNTNHYEKMCQASENAIVQFYAASNPAEITNDFFVSQRP